MKRWILFVLSMALLYYVALIYFSHSMLFLVCAVLILELCLQAYNLFLFRKLHISIHTPVTIIDQNGVLPVELVLSNKSILPSGQIRVQLQVCYPTQKKKQYYKFCSVVPGRRMKREKASIGLKFDLKPRHTGRVELSVRRVRMLDLLGILPSFLSRKNTVDQSVVMVLPEKREIPLEMNLLVQQSRINCETEIRVSGEKDPPEISLIREYQPGDALRNIHWKLTAKQDALMVRDYISRQGSPILFFIDLRELSESYFQVFYSLGLELLRQKCSYYLVYYKPDGGELVRTMITSEEDLYGYLLQTDMTGQGNFSAWKPHFRFRRKGAGRKKREPEILLPDWEGAYREKYRQLSAAGRLVLRRDLAFLYNDEVIWNP